MRELEVIIRESIRASSEDFLQVIDKADRIISSELRGLGKLKVTGRLIHLPPRGEAIVIGDIHGDLTSLEYILKDSEFMRKALSKRDVYLIFLGDYGDRGIHSPEVYYVVLSLKILFPERVLLLQGNHEGPSDLLAHPHDLPYHLQIRFGGDWRKIYDKLSSLFRKFYTATIVNGRCLMLHGGVPSEAKGMDDLAYAYRKHPYEGHLEEILWSDPEEGIKGTFPSPRGAGKIFGEDITLKFLNMLGVKLLIRGHEPASDGYKINHEGRILTLFSRKGSPYYNLHGAYLIFDLNRRFDSAWDLEEFVRRF